MIRGNRQGQSAGDNSSQIQLHGDLTIINNSGITEAQAREIFQELSEQRCIAQGKARKNVEKFNMRAAYALHGSGKLDAVSEPSFQFEFQNAQIAAASSDSETDHDLLTRLISELADDPNDRRVRAGVSQALSVIDKLDYASLHALTAYFALDNYIPLRIFPEAGLDTLDEIFTNLLEDHTLAPADTGWIEHLDLLGAVNISTLGEFAKFEEYYPKKTPSYVSKGIQIGSADERLLREELRQLEAEHVIVEHSLKPGFIRAAGPGILYLSQLYPEVYRDWDAIINTLEESAIEEQEDTVKDKYLQLLDEHRSLARIRSWRNSLPGAFRITPLGRLLATTNIQRLTAEGIMPHPTSAH